jgi:hypothetical protein
VLPLGGEAAEVCYLGGHSLFDKVLVYLTRFWSI